jgi:hypothetical protein
MKITGDVRKYAAEQGIAEEKLSQVVGPDEAQRLARHTGYFDDGKARLTFVFEDEEDYIEAIKYFGRKPDVLKLLQLIGINRQDE